MRGEGIVHGGCAYECGGHVGVFVASVVGRGGEFWNGGCMLCMRQGTEERESA